MNQTRGMKALIIVMITTAIVIAPMLLLGIYLGYYVGGAVGYSKSTLAIAFSTVGFLSGMAVMFRVIRSVLAWTNGRV